MIDKNIEQGATAIVSAISWAIPAATPVASVIAKALSLQWTTLWEIKNYDKGNGVIITAWGGGAPLVITDVISQ